MLVRLPVQLAQPFEFLKARNMNIPLTILHEGIFVFNSRSCTAKNLSGRQWLTLWNLHLVVFTQIFVHSLHDEHNTNEFLVKKRITVILASVVWRLDNSIHRIITIQWISVNKTNHAVHWIAIYPLDSVIQLLNDWALCKGECNYALKWKNEI